MIEWAFSLSAAGASIFSHELVLRFITQKCNKLRMVWVMIILSVSHSFHIWLYALVTYIAVEKLALGTISGCICDNILDYVYFSASNYTSLGFGDYIASGEIRFLATFEALFGLLMIGWSTAFAFWWMQRHWLSIDNQ